MTILSEGFKVPIKVKYFTAIHHFPLFLCLPFDRTFWVYYRVPFRSEISNVVIHCKQKEVKEALLYTQLCICPVVFSVLLILVLHVKHLSNLSRQYVSLWLWQFGDLFSDPIYALLSIDVKDDHVFWEFSHCTAVVFPDSLGDTDDVGERGI